MKNKLNITLLALAICAGFNTKAEAQQTKTANKPQEKQADQVYVIADKMPVFPGGEEALKKYFADGLASVKSETGGMLTLSLLINKAGQVQDVSVTQGIGTEVNQKAMQLAQAMPKWEPGVKGKEKVNVRIAVPVMVPRYDPPVSDKAPADEKVYAYVEQMPMFPGSTSNGIMDYLAASIKYPDSGIQNGTQGMVVVSYVVASNGEIRDPKILKGLGPDFDNEVLRVINSMPRWTPGRQNGRPVAVQYNLPVRFTLPAEKAVEKK